MVVSFQGASEEFKVPDGMMYVRGIGRGGFGTVAEFRDNAAGRSVAVKKVPGAYRCDKAAKRSRREVEILRGLQHANIIRLLDLYTDSAAKDMYFVMELALTDFCCIIDSEVPLPEVSIRWCSKQIFQGVAFIHSVGIMHRDLKPGNILLFADRSVKLCDFGLARGFGRLRGAGGTGCSGGAGASLPPFAASPAGAVSADAADAADAAYSDSVDAADAADAADADVAAGARIGRAVVRPLGGGAGEEKCSEKGGADPCWTLRCGTLHYRAPEVLLFVPQYGFKVDVWAAGCIVCEMVGRRAVFRGSSNGDQLRKVFHILGHSCAEQAKWLQDQPAARALVDRFAGHSGKSWKKVYPQASESLTDAISRIVCFDPDQRPSAEECLQLPFFLQSDWEPKDMASAPEEGAAFFMHEPLDRSPSLNDLLPSSCGGAAAASTVQAACAGLRRGGA